MTDLANADISYADVRDSIAVAKSHGEKFFEQIVWQVENEAWTVLGYGSWDEMREAEYGDMAVVAPRADRPQFVSRLRARGLTQQQIAGTLGASVGTVNSDLKFSSENEAREPITNARGQQRPATYQRQPEPPTTDGVGTADTVEPLPPFDPATGELLDDEPEPAPRPKPNPPKPRRRPITDQARDAGWDLRKVTDRLERIIADDRYPRNKEEVATYLRGHLLHTVEVCQDLLDQLNPEGN